METFSALLALCAGNSPVTCEFPSQRPVTQSFDIFFDLRLNKRLSKQSWGWWFERPSRSLWRHRDVFSDTTLLKMTTASQRGRWAIDPICHTQRWSIGVVWGPFTALANLRLQEIWRTINVYKLAHLRWKEICKAKQTRATSTVTAKTIKILAFLGKLQHSLYVIHLATCLNRLGRYVCFVLYVNGMATRDKMVKVYIIWTPN